MRLLVTLAVIVAVFTPTLQGAESLQRNPQAIIRRGRRLLQMLENGAAREDPVKWRSYAAETLRLLLWTSIVPGGQMAPALVPTGDRLVRKMRTWAGGEVPPPTPQEMRQWVQDLQDIYRLGRRLSSSPPNQKQLARARNVLQLELSRSIYVEARRPGANLSQRLANLVARYVMDPLFGKRTRPARHALLVICFALLALLLAHVIWELARASRQSASHGGTSSSVKGEELLARSRTAEQLLARGDAAREDGELLRAMGLYYLALIAALAKAGCTPLDRSLTNWEHYHYSSRCRQLDNRQVSRLEEMTRFFDHHCYGPRSPSGDDADHLREQVAEFVDVLS
jgi:hypothetical protein